MTGGSEIMVCDFNQGPARQTKNFNGIFGTLARLTPERKTTCHVNAD
jgi:hypothetical protein